MLTCSATLLSALVCRQSSAKGGAAAAPQRASALEVFFLSSLAKAGATLLTYPMMNIKTRMHTATRSSGGSSSGGERAPPQATGILQAAAEILRNEGGWASSSYGRAGKGPHLPAGLSEC
jgi:adenine nucleotide transporter 17